MMTVPAATPCDLQSAHQVTAACPLRCLQASLTAAQIRAALARHAGLTPARTEKKEHPHMTSPAAVTGPAGIDALDLEPIAFKLMHPEPRQTVMTLAEADQLIALYRAYLKLCAWYPEDDIVPSKEIDQVWHAHILDTGKYAADCGVRVLPAPLPLLRLARPRRHGGLAGRLRRHPRAVPRPLRHPGDRRHGRGLPRQRQHLRYRRGSHLQL
jgi:hypothetical protein